MKKKLIYVLIVIILIVVQLVAEELDLKNKVVDNETVKLIENLNNETDELIDIESDLNKDDGKKINEETEEPIKSKYIYDEIMVKTNREYENELNNKLCYLNKMTHDALIELNGIGDVTAKKILAYKITNGSFKKLEELMEVNGIGIKKYTSIEEQL